MSNWNGRAWCSLHQMMMGECFELHHPEAYPQAEEDFDIILWEREWFMLPCRHLVPVTGETRGKAIFTIECECGQIWDFERTPGELQVRSH